MPCRYGDTIFVEDQSTNLVLGRSDDAAASPPGATLNQLWWVSAEDTPTSWMAVPVGGGRFDGTTAVNGDFLSFGDKVILKATTTTTGSSSFRYLSIASASKRYFLAVSQIQASIIVISGRDSGLTASNEGGLTLLDAGSLVTPLTPPQLFAIGRLYLTQPKYDRDPFGTPALAAAAAADARVAAVPRTAAAAAGIVVGGKAAVELASSTIDVGSRRRRDHDQDGEEDDDDADDADNNEDHWQWAPPPQQHTGGGGGGGDGGAGWYDPRHRVPSKRGRLFTIIIVIILLMLVLLLAYLWTKNMHNGKQRPSQRQDDGWESTPAMRQRQYQQQQQQQQQTKNWWQKLFQ